VLALQLNVIEPDLRPRLVERLIELLHENGDRLDTGLLSTAHLLPLLSDNNHDTLAYDILLGEKAPSWMYEIRRGATTIWEMWRAIEESGNVVSVSQNQPGLSTIGDWLYRYVGGIQAASPGYKSLRIDPHPDRRFSSAETRFESPYGAVTTVYL
jgi:alpha-L-rhamnosidase